MEINKKVNKFPRSIRFQTILIGILFTADSLFMFFEQNFFNIYLVHVLKLTELHISLMVSLSAIMGLIFQLSWGIISDNTRSKFGRRRPYLLIGGLIAGVAGILYAFSPNYFWALFLDVVIIGIFANAYFSAEKSLIPDTIDIEYRGRANGIITALGNIGILVAVALFLVVNEFFTIPNPSGEGTILTQGGYIFVLSIGGGFFIIAGVLGFIFIKEKSIAELPAKKSFFSEVKEMIDINELKKQKEFLKITFAYLIFQTGIATIMPFLFLYIFSLGLTTLQLLIGIAIGFPILILATMMLGKISDKYGRKKYVPLSIIIASAGILLASFVKTNSGVNLILFYISLPFVLIGVLGLATLLNAWSQDLLPADKRGKFVGILNIVFTISQIIGAFTAGLVATFYGLQWIFLLAIVYFLTSVVFFKTVKETLVL